MESSACNTEGGLRLERGRAVGRLPTQMEEGEDIRALAVAGYADA